MVKVRVQVVERLKKSENAPRFPSHYVEKRVMENNRFGHHIDLFQARDKDGDNLFYSIIGNVQNTHVLLPAGHSLITVVSPIVGCYWHVQDKLPA